MAITVVAATVLIVVLARPSGVICAGRPPLAGALPSSAWLRAAIEDVPCGSTDRVSYATVDDHGEPMDALDPIDDPRGGYLGVYHSPVRRSGADGFAVSLARSTDLIHWRRVRVLAPIGASDPTLRAIAGAAGYLLAYERQRARGGDVIVVRYYANLRSLLSGGPSAERELPRRFSSLNNGTPSIESIDWRGGVARSLIVLGFHYETAQADGRPGPDREALGVLAGFRRWSARRDTGVDALLDRVGLRASHGDRRPFDFGARAWRIYEAQRTLGDFGTWRVLLYDVARRRLTSLSPVLPGGRVPGSFGNPTVEILRAPGGHGAVLAVTMFVFGSGPASPYRGELVYYQGH